ncbi:hypothetical protein XAP412_430005 [Xanthomonas phaseoli pv. phaseoli]|uniref:Uncharacterized protein n=1 Tax=Xanthomonas campestris pv. phaseoli TaxID=317013 RepID=A0AB38E211_XANCH|nr:hypothetical protein XAP6984_480005 [Xanthomonas phaseoli pv. phaseoli]SON85516.1 hypothetical protein XAP412_430005 [Xanthomonas phaseoli pv. phaseoli]SON90147.1 hypothetical protein XAP7430_450006 [Xanthomonas phaseoli pv. phaseoli]
MNCDPRRLDATAPRCVSYRFIAAANPDTSAQAATAFSIQTLKSTTLEMLFATHLQAAPFPCLARIAARNDPDVFGLD